MWQRSQIIYTNASGTRRANSYCGVRPFQSQAEIKTAARPNWNLIPQVMPTLPMVVFPPTAFHQDRQILTRPWPKLIRTEIFTGPLLLFQERCPKCRSVIPMRSIFIRTRVDSQAIGPSQSTTRTEFGDGTERFETLAAAHTIHDESAPPSPPIQLFSLPWRRILRSLLSRIARARL